MFSLRSKIIPLLLTVLVALSVHSPSSALVVNQKIAPMEALKVNWNGTNLIVAWRSPSLSTIKPTSYRVQVKSGKISQTKFINVKSKQIKFSGLKKTLNYEIQVWRVTNKFQSIPLKTVFIGSKNKQNNAISYKKLSDMFIDAEPQTISAKAPSGNIQTTILTPLKCAIENGKLKPIAVGECIVEFSANATKYFLSAEVITQRITVAPRVIATQKVLLWEDNFNGSAETAPSSSNWTADVSDGCQAPYNNCGWGNGERQWYAESQNRHDGLGKLTVKATKLDNTSNLNCYYGRCEWRSGKITTFKKVAFTYGYMEASIKAPKGGGTWPAFWMLGTNIETLPWPRSGELDIWEYKGSYPQLTYATVHFANSGGGHTYLGGTKDVLFDLSDDFHRYGMLWLEDEITFFIDDILIYKVTKDQSGLAFWPFGKNAQGKEPKFYAIFNLAMGGHFGGPIDSKFSNAEIKVDWVKYYSVDGIGKVTLN